MTGDYFRLRVLELAPQVFVAGQVFEQELKVAAEQGIRSVINNRPDGESANQPPSAHLAGVAEGLGMTYVHVPVVSGSITPQNIEEFRQVCESLGRDPRYFGRCAKPRECSWTTSDIIAGHQCKQRIFSDTLAVKSGAWFQDRHY
jgi:sulfide:quinone oxidoreductase